MEVGFLKKDSFIKGVINSVFFVLGKIAGYGNIFELERIIKSRIGNVEWM